MSEQKRRFVIPKPGYLWLCAILLILVNFGLWFLIPYWQFQRSIRYIESIGGQVTLAYNDRPHWQRIFLGEEVLSVGLSFTKVTDSDLQHIQPLNSHRGLNLEVTTITGNGLRHLRTCSDLEFLSLNETQVDDAGLVHLKENTRLRELNLSDTMITDDGVKHLTDIAELDVYPAFGIA